jgi:hypothetical protein
VLTTSVTSLVLCGVSVKRKVTRPPAKMQCPTRLAVRVVEGSEPESEASVLSEDDSCGDSRPRLSGRRRRQPRSGERMQPMAQAVGDR